MQRPWSSANDLSAKVDAYEAALAELEQQKKEHEAALAALEPWLGNLSQSQFAKLAPMQEEINALKGQMEASAQNEDFAEALELRPTISRPRWMRMKRLWRSWSSRRKTTKQRWRRWNLGLGNLSQSQFAKLAPMQEEINALKGQMEASAQNEDFAEALDSPNDLSAKVDVADQAKPLADQGY